MRWLPKQPAARRGVIVALDGLAIWLLAIVLAAYADPGSVDGSSGGFIPTAVDTTIRWATTAGVGAFELVAFAGLAVAVVGPTWYAVVRPVMGRGRSERLRGVLERGTDGFRYEQPGSPVSDVADELELGHDPLGSADGSPATTGHNAGRDRIAELFDSSPPTGDFLRGSSDGTTDEPEPAPAADDSYAVESGDPATVPSDEILVSMDERDEAVDLEITVRTDGDPDSRDAVTQEAGVDGGAGEEPASEAAADDSPDRTSEEPSTTRDPTDERTDADEEASDPRTGERGASIDELGATMAASQARIERASDRVVATVNGSRNEEFPDRLGSISGAATGRFGELRALDSDELLPIGQRVPEIRASQRRFEAAVDAFVDGE